MSSNESTPIRTAPKFAGAMDSDDAKRLDRAYKLVLDAHSSLMGVKHPVAERAANMLLKVRDELDKTG